MDTEQCVATFPYKVVEATLRQLHQIDPAQDIALLARFRYLQRMGFPVAKVGRGKKVAYGFDEIMQIALAFELLQVGVLPVRAIRLVRTGWGRTRAALVATSTGGGTKVMLTLFPRALDEMAPELGDEGRPAADPIGRLEVRELRRWLDDTTGGAPSCLVIDPSRLIARLLAALAAAVGDDKGIHAGFKKFSVTYAQN